MLFVLCQNGRSWGPGSSYINMSLERVVKMMSRVSVEILYRHHYAIPSFAEESRSCDRGFEDFA